MNPKIIGIDFGNENIVLSIYQSEGIDLIDSPTGKHYLPNCITCIKKEIKCGVDIYSPQVKRLPKNTVLGLKKLLQIKTEEQKEKEAQYYHCLPSLNKIFSIGELGDISIQILLIYVFRMIKELTQADYCVIGISEFYENEEKQILQQVCEIVNMPCLGLVRESIAIATYYYVYNLSFDERMNDEGTLQMFLDIGDSETTCSIFRFKNSVIELISSKTISFTMRVAVP